MKKFLKAALCLLMCVSIIGCGGSGTNKEESNDNKTETTWPETELSSRLPKPDNDEVFEIVSNSEDTFSFSITNTDINVYNDYVKKSKDAGYTVIVDDGEENFDSYDSEGYHLTVNYISDDSKISIVLDDTINDKELEWPTSELAQLLPKPKSNTGKIGVDSSTTLSIQVSNTSKEDYKKYIEECKKKGFTENYYNASYFYTADDKNGHSLKVTFYESNIMWILL